MPPRKSVRRSLRKQKHSKRRNTRKTNRKTMRRQSRMRKTNRKTMRRKNKYRKSLRGGVGSRPLPPTPIPAHQLGEGTIKGEIIRNGVEKNALYTTYDYLEREKKDLYDKLLFYSDKGQDHISRKNKIYFSNIRKKIEITINSADGVENSRKNFAKSNFSNCLLKSSGPFLTKNDAIKLFDLIDKDGNRSITTQELLSIYALGPEDKQQIPGIKSRIERIEGESGMETNGQIEIYEFITYLINKNKIIQEGENEIFKPEKLEELSNPDFAMAKGRELIQEVIEEEEEEEDEDEDEDEDEGKGADPQVAADLKTINPHSGPSAPPRSGTPDSLGGRQVRAERRAAAKKAAAATKIQAIQRGLFTRREQQAKAAADEKAAAAKKEQENLLELILKQHNLIKKTFDSLSFK